MDKPPHIHPPLHNIISALAYSVQGSDVDTMIVDGKIIMENRDIKNFRYRKDNVFLLKEYQKI